MSCFNCNNKPEHLFQVCHRDSGGIFIRRAKKATVKAYCRSCAVICAQMFKEFNEPEDEHEEFLGAG